MDILRRHGVVSSREQAEALAREVGELARDGGSVATASQLLRAAGAGAGAEARAGHAGSLGHDRADPRGTIASEAAQLLTGDRENTWVAAGGED